MAFHGRIVSPGPDCRNIRKDISKKHKNRQPDFARFDRNGKFLKILPDSVDKSPKTDYTTDRFRKERQEPVMARFVTVRFYYYHQSGLSVVSD